MGFWDFLGGSEYDKHEESLDKKLTKILEEMEIPDWRELCKNLIGSFPRNKLRLSDKKGDEVFEFKDPISRNDYYTFYAHYQDLGEVTDMMLAKYFVKHKILSKHDEDFVYLDTHDKDEEPKDEKKEESKDDGSINMDSILRKLEKEFQPEKLQSEDHLQAQIVQFLKAKFPNASVERELQLKKVRGSIDIVVNGKYAIEVKVPESRTTLRNLSAQLEEYKEEYPEICAVILDNEELNLYEDIKYYSERYKSKLDIDSVILSGKKRG